MSAWYNENDPKAAAWLRELIHRGLIAPGDVDERSIVDVRPDDLRGYAQCHFFAGIGVWSYAARRAGWPDDRPLWTGSEPCQPFSAAGKGKGFSDERFLRPYWQHLIRVCRPPTIVGEQVASKDGLAWLDVIQSDLEGEDYAFGATDLCAAGFGAPHIRQRLYWLGTQGLADDDDERCERARRTRRRWARFADDGADGGVGHSLGAGLEGHPGHGDDPGRRSLATGPVAATGEPRGLSVPDDAFWRANLSRGDLDDGANAGRAEDSGDAGPGGAGGGLADSNGEGRGRSTQFHGPRGADQEECWPDDGGCGPEFWLADNPGGRRGEECPDVGGRAIGDSAQGLTPGSVNGRGDLGRPGPTNGHWGDADWLLCRDGKWRPVEPGTFPLAHGAAARVGRLRGFGNAIVAQVAEGFIRSYLEAEADGFDIDRVGSGSLIDADLADLLG